MPRRGSRSGAKGMVLFLALITVMAVAGLLSALFMASGTRSRSAALANAELELRYAAQAGLERIRFAVLDAATADPPDYMYLRDAAASCGPEYPVHSFAVGAHQVTTFVEILSTSGDPFTTWYLLRSRAASATKQVSEIAETCQLTDTFARYVVFSDETLSIGDFARYGGDVHSNANVSIDGHHTTYLGDLTATGRITFANANARNTATFAKRVASGVPRVARPTVANIQEMATNPPPGSIVNDWASAAFKARFQAATGVNPDGGTIDKTYLKTKLAFDRTTVRVETEYKTASGQTATFTETPPVPNGAVIYSSGATSVSGHVSRRTSIFTPDQITVTGPVRYVDDSDNPQYVLYNGSGESMPFDYQSDSWQSNLNWAGTNHDYRQADDWASRAPFVDGKQINPALGLVSGGTIWINNSDRQFPRNVELHAMLYSATDVQRPTDTTDPNGHNLIILGGRVQKGSSPNSSAWQFRHYLYDEHLAGNPPPGFPFRIAPGFSNWHILR